MMMDAAVEMPLTKLDHRIQHTISPGKLRCFHLLFLDDNVIFALHKECNVLIQTCKPQPAMAAPLI